MERLTSSTPAYWIITLILTSLIATCPSSHLDTAMPSVSDLLSLTSVLRFVAPQHNKTQWQEIDSELREILSPTHFGLANNVITPQDAGSQFSMTVYDFLKSKPEFVQDISEKTEYRKNKPKTLQQAKKIKNSLRKKLKQKDATPEDRKMFGQSVRYHNFLLNEQRNKDKDNLRKHQEKMYNDNFWEFSKKLTRGQLDLPSLKPTFDKAAADRYYPNMYSSAPVFEPSSLNWFPYLKVPPSPVNFNMSPVKPKDIKHILSQKKSNSAPGPDGFTYGVLKHLTSTHHFLATLYSKILLESPAPPELWQSSNVSLIFKRNDTDNPKNFRMIALTSIIGKLFHQIISDRLLEYMISNGYINNAVQKAFIKNVNGTVEHNQLLQEVISHARRNNKTCHVTFFDLKDAFGSISHSLIDHVLCRYHIPDNVKTYINTLYSNISGAVSGPGWNSERFIFRRGVFQGDPLSPTIFICVFNPLLEYLLSEQKHGYHLNKNTPIITTPFADDFNVITTNSRTHQRILHNVEKYAKTMNLNLEPAKCKSLSISSGSSKIVNFKLSDLNIDSIVNSPEKFLGSQITFSGKQNDIFSYIYDGITQSLDNIDNSLIRGEYKLKVYSNYLLPALRFKLTVHEITNSNLAKLDALTDRYLKKWLAMPPSGTMAIIHAREGLNIKTLSHIYKEAHAVSHATSRLKADATVNAALDSRIAREEHWTRKASVTTYSEEHFQQALPDNSHARPTTKQIETVKNRIKSNVSLEFYNKWTNHIKSLLIQGKFLEIIAIEETDLSWKSLIYNLPRGILQFAVNAAIDTLATNANLKRWGKRTNAKCDHCGNRETLHHTLNNCKEMLDRYLWRHNSVLSYMYECIKFNPKDDDTELYVDLPFVHQGASTIPIDIIITQQKPDLVLVDRNNKKLTIMELSIPFETNIDSTHGIKLERYRKLISDIEQNDYCVNYYPIEIGSRGLISKDNEARLKSFLKNSVKQCKFTEAKHTLCKIVLISSFVIYHSKYEDSWINPRYVTIDS